MRFPETNDPSVELRLNSVSWTYQRDRLRLELHNPHRVSVRCGRLALVAVAVGERSPIFRTDDGPWEFPEETEFGDAAILQPVTIGPKGSFHANVYRPSTPNDPMPTMLVGGVFEWIEWEGRLRRRRRQNDFSIHEVVDVQLPPEFS